MGAKTRARTSAPRTLALRAATAVLPAATVTVPAEGRRELVLAAP